MVREATGDAILDEIVELIGRITGDDSWIDFTVTRQTTLNDLALESIEFLTLVEALRERYGDIDFVETLANMDIDEMAALSVGDLVTSVDRVRPSDGRRPEGP
jgi:acyl carrier protein